MARVVIIGKNQNELVQAPEVCPVMAFRRGPNGELVIDPNICIDCGVCQTVVPEGAILPDDEADDASILFNETNSQEWPEA